MSSDSPQGNLMLHGKILFWVCQFECWVCSCKHLSQLATASYQGRYEMVSCARLLNLLVPSPPLVGKGEYQTLTLTVDSLVIVSFMCIPALHSALVRVRSSCRVPAHSFTNLTQSLSE